MKAVRLTLILFACAVLVGLVAPPASAQPQRETGLRLTVSDQSGAVIVNANVTVRPTDPAGSLIQATTNEHGEALFEGITPGRYSVLAAFPGFEAKQLDDVRVRAGSSTRREIKLNIAKIAED